ncbi:oxidoreductase [Dinghuibacter silviterrae]|uniref:Short-subunit dehydrogenase n=1 Tax=Dinghuibacter silviterrae TaxID=1539049 RepID=A0A4R8DF15_9BACT|nr:oxidoreductase [Dinghuibacter silviterrae]TDW96161.1 short-subunit dehydrogenase [Dinghuibacter silviterrae]
MKKVVLITGASSGMGKETAKLLLQQGYTVYGAARRVERMEDVQKLGGKVLRMDVTDDDDMVRGVEEMLKKEGRIDVLINNAGFGSYGTVEDVPMADARYQMEVNVFGLARLCQLVIPHLRAQGSGKIVNITSIGGKVVTPFGAWYHASKFAVEALSDALRMELKPFGVDVIVIEPGGVQTEWGDIAMANLVKVSGQGAYKGLVDRVLAIMPGIEAKAAPPSVIAKLIARVLLVKKPRTRYHGGYMAGTVLTLRKWMPDKVIDAALLSRLK